MKKKELTTDSLISQTEELVASEIDGETVMMSIENGKYYGLDNIGSFIWEQIESPVSVSDLMDMILLDYDIDRETCERDVMAFLKKLYDDDIILVQALENR